MTTERSSPVVTLRRCCGFWIGFAAGGACSIAGVVSYFASSSPDGLDSATTLQGVEVVETDAGEHARPVTASPRTRPTTRCRTRRSPTTRSAARSRSQRARRASSASIVTLAVARWRCSGCIARSRGAKPPPRAPDGGCGPRPPALPRRRRRPCTALPAEVEDRLRRSSSFSRWSRRHARCSGRSPGIYAILIVLAVWRIARHCAARGS